MLFRKSREGEESLIEPDSTASYIPLYWSGKNSGLLSFVKSGLNPSLVMMNSRLFFLFCMKIFYMDRWLFPIGKQREIPSSSRVCHGSKWSHFEWVYVLDMMWRQSSLSRRKGRHRRKASKINSSIACYWEQVYGLLLTKLVENTSVVVDIILKYVEFYNLSN